MDTGPFEDVGEGGRQRVPLSLGFPSLDPRRVVEVPSIRTSVLTSHTPDRHLLHETTLPLSK